MVVFSCNACGGVMKKSQVEAHSAKCYDCRVLSCADCSKEFHGNEYKTHVKCISEEEKYSGKNYNPKANKGEQKQSTWLENVRAAVRCAETDAQLQNLLQRIEDHPNIPRKFNKFENFLKSSMRIWDKTLVKKAWDAIKEQADKQHTASQQTTVEKKIEEKHEETTKMENGMTDESVELTKRQLKDARREERKKVKKRKMNDADDDENAADGDKKDGVVDGCTKEKKSKKKKKKQQMETGECEDTNQAVYEVVPDMKEDDEQEEDTPAPPVGKFKWDDMIISILKRAPDNEMAIKKIRKKVLAEYAAHVGDGKTRSEEKLLGKFTQKLTHNPKVKVRKERAKLVA